MNGNPRKSAAMRASWTDPTSRERRMKAAARRRIVCTPEMEAAIRAMRAAGLPWLHIQLELGLTQGPFGRIMRQLGLTKKRGTQPATSGVGTCHAAVDTP